MNNELANYNLILNVINAVNSPLHCVLCTETGRVLCLTNTYKTALAISTIQNTKLWRDLHLTHKIPVEINLNLPQKYVFDISSQFFRKQGVPSNDLYKYVLISEKAAALDQLFRLLSEELNPEDDIDPTIIMLKKARWDATERMRQNFTRQILLCETLSELNMVYEEMNREASIYGNF